MSERTFLNVARLMLLTGLLVAAFTDREGLAWMCFGLLVLALTLTPEDEK